MSEPKLEERTEQPYVSIPIKASLKQWDRVNALVPEVQEWLRKHQLAPTGPPFFRYWVIGGFDEPFDLEIGFPVASNAEAEGDERVIAGSIHAGTYATVMHHGHPDQIVKTHEKLLEWGRQQGLEWNNKKDGDTEVWGGFFEFYRTNPEVEPDPEKWETEIIYRVKDGRLC